MTERDGCPTGYEKRGSINACFLKNRVKNIPFTINTKVGCDNFGGKWDNSYGFGVCLMEDTIEPSIWIGWTAPIRGLYFYWTLQKSDPDEWMDEEMQKEIRQKGGDPKDYSFDGEVMGCIVKDNPGYPNDPHPCRSAMVGGPDDWYFETDMPFGRMAEHYKGYALNMARDIMLKEDRESWKDFDYYDRGGRKLKGYHHDATPVERSSGYGDVEAPTHSGKTPFRIRR
jgi:hypothetical protein